MIRLEYVPLQTVVLWDKNPKKHDLSKIATSIERYGFKDPPKYDSTLGGLVEGNGRTQALRLIQSANKPIPKGIGTDVDGNWCIPVLFGDDFESTAVATAYAIDHNNLTLSTLSAVEALKVWDADGYMALLDDLAEYDGFPVTVNRNDLSLLMDEIMDSDSFGKRPSDGSSSSKSSDDDVEEYQIVVICRDTDHLRNTLIQLTEMGLEVIVK